MANSYGIHVDYTWDAKLAIAHLESGAMLLDSYINSALVTSSWKVKEEIASRAPEGVGGLAGYGLKDSVAIDIDSRAKTATIEPKAKYAAAVEYGSRPHMPPTDPNGSLAQWCDMKGLKLWAVAMHIKMFGTKPHPYVEPAYQATKGQVSDVFEMAIRQYAEAV